MSKQIKSPAGRGPDFGGQFRVEAVLAEGGMGTVYRAIQVALGRPVAIKVLKAGGDAAHADAAQGLRRFVAEALLAARGSDPHVVRVLTAGTGKDGPYVVYELVEGRTLRSILEAEPRLSAERAVAFAVQACHGLDAVHRAGIVHRDVKPENLLVDAEDRLKLTDLGIARDLGAPGLEAVRSGREEERESRPGATGQWQEPTLEALGQAETQETRRGEEPRGYGLPTLPGP